MERMTRVRISRTQEHTPSVKPRTTPLTHSSTSHQALSQQQVQEVQVTQRTGNAEGMSASEASGRIGHSFANIPLFPPHNALPKPLKAGIEQLSGINMDDVQVHYQSSLPAQVHALASAQGNHIFLGNGQERHLPHEAWHVVQQKQGRVQPRLSLNGQAINADTTLEREASAMGERAMHTQPVHPVHSDNYRQRPVAMPPTRFPMQLTLQDAKAWVRRNRERTNYPWPRNPLKKDIETYIAQKGNGWEELKAEYERPATEEGEPMKSRKEQKERKESAKRPKASGEFQSEAKDVASNVEEMEEIDEEPFVAPEVTEKQKVKKDKLEEDDEEESGEEAEPEREQEKKQTIKKEKQEKGIGREGESSKGEEEEVGPQKQELTEEQKSSLRARLLKETATLSKEEITLSDKLLSSVQPQKRQGEKIKNERAFKGKLSDALRKIVNSHYNDLKDLENPKKRLELKRNRMSEVARAAQKAVENDEVIGSYIRAASPGSRAQKAAYDTGSEQVLKLQESRVIGQSQDTLRQEAVRSASYFLGEEDAKKVLTAYSVDTAIPEHEAVVNGVVLDFAKENQEKLNFVLQMWPATQDPEKGFIFVQHIIPSPGGGKKAPSEEAVMNAAYWELFRTVLHEFLHATTSPLYTSAANAQRSKYNVLIEGGTDFFTDYIWQKLRKTIPSDAALQKQIQGYYDPKFNPDLIKSDDYPETKQVEQFVQALGNKGFANFAAAYFLGEVELIGLKKE